MARYDSHPPVLAEQRPDANRPEAEKTDAELGIRARTWDEAKSLDNFPDDDYLAGYLRWRQDYPTAKSYGYLIRRPAGPEDRQSLDSRLGAAYHYQLAGLVGQRLKLEPSPDYIHPPQNQAAIDRAKAAHQEELNAKVQSLWTRAAGGNYPPPDDPDFKLDGFSLKIGDSDHGLDEPFLLDPAYAANVHIPNKSFVHWASQSQVERFLNQQERSISGRIYLNPTVDQNVEVFADLIDLFDQNQAACEAKIFNRALEAGGQPPATIRSEGITVYVPADQADKVLGLVLDYCQNNPEAFAQRQGPPLAVEVAPGVGLATQEGFDARHSFNGHRAKIFDKAWELLQTVEMPPSRQPSEQLEAFKYILEQLCLHLGVNPKNIAFANN